MCALANVYCIANDKYRVHTGERPLQCDLCDRSFNRANGLKVHRRSVSAFVPAILNHVANPDKHRTHTGERPFACDLCDKSFGDKSHVNRHKRSVLRYCSNVLSGPLTVLA